MISVDEHALICDLAETYQIYDYRQLPASLVAVFAYGLRDDSRIKLKLSEQSISLEIMLLASMADNLNVLLWSKTEDGKKGRNKPKSIVESLTKRTKQESDTIAFSSGEEFEEKRKRLLKGGE